MNRSPGAIALAAIVLLGLAGLVSRRSLPVAAALCFVALSLLGYGASVWLSDQ